MSILSEFLNGCGVRDGIFLISEPRSFHHPEEEYDVQYGIDKLGTSAFQSEGEALLGLCEEFGYNSSGPVLEIGCGTGRLSLALALNSRLGEILITDPSFAFCGITARKLRAVASARRNARVAVLSAEDLGKLPTDTFSLIALRSVLHHILDIRRFFFDCSERLLSDGVLLFEEPCYEGYVLIGAITQLIPDALKGQGVPLQDEDLRHIRCLAETMRWYARRDMDKSGAEDKHLFRPDELMRLSEECGMTLEFFPNRVFANIHDRNIPLPEDYFENFYCNYIRHAMRWPAELVDLIHRYGHDYFRYFSVFASGGAMPYTYGTFLCRKTGRVPRHPFSGL